MIFPNTFEYFFIFYEAVRLRWDPKRMSKTVVIGAAAFIWIFIKLPHLIFLSARWILRRLPPANWGLKVAADPILAVSTYGKEASEVDTRSRHFLVLVYALLLSSLDGSINLENTLFFVLLLTLTVALYDHYRQVYQMRFAEGG